MVGKANADQNCVREICSADFRMSWARRCAEAQMTTGGSTYEKAI